MTMESYFDGRDEEREFRVQRERRKRMRRERQRRIRRQRMKRRILCVGIFVILITFFGLAIKFGRKSRGNETLYMGGEVLCAKTGYITQARNCAVSYGTFGGTLYICVTVGSTSSWRCIYDHVEIYNETVNFSVSMEEKSF